MRRKSFFVPVIVLLFYTSLVSSAFSQNIPDRPVPPRLVNDFAGMLKSEEVNILERKLVSFNDSTSTQIAIVIVPSLDGYDKSDYAQRLAEKWGIGQKGLNNGLLILIKPKTGNSQGEVFIAQGYGLEGAIPDITCGEIVDYDILPAFRNSDYLGGLDKATNTLMSLARGEFTAAEYGKTAKKSTGKEAPIGLILFIIVIIIAMISKGSGGGSNRKHLSSGGLPFWMLLGMMNSGRGSGGSWGGFSGGSGGGSGGGGGFGGFGGGSFGGGGAGGSW